MPRRISWKKGMRLTDEVLKAADNCTSDAIGQALVLASAGRMGLFPSVRPFQLSLSIARGFVEVESLDCLAMTRGGDIIDVQFDTKFSNTFDSRVQIPQEDEQEFLLTINLIPDSWKESVEGYQSQDFTFSLVGPKTAIPDTPSPSHESSTKKDGKKTPVFLFHHVFMSHPIVSLKNYTNSL